MGLGSGELLGSGAWWHRAGPWVTTGDGKVGCLEISVLIKNNKMNTSIEVPQLAPGTLYNASQGLQPPALPVGRRGHVLCKVPTKDVARTRGGGRVSSLMSITIPPIPMQHQVNVTSISIFRSFKLIYCNLGPYTPKDVLSDRASELENSNRWQIMHGRRSANECQGPVVFGPESTNLLEPRALAAEEVTDIERHPLTFVPQNLSAKGRIHTS
ncbi:hypothetical protein EV360DRAFT_73510 [Lentinula raphanica]|nr:hypothetical protein EV360DRAFT_73510 [Lentinula raphanica]